LKILFYQFNVCNKSHSWGLELSSFLPAAKIPPTHICIGHLTEDYIIGKESETPLVSFYTDQCLLII